MNNMSWINGQIAVSGAFTDQDIPLLKKQGIKAVIDIRSERRDNEELLKKHGMDYLRVKVDDTFSPSLEQFADVMDFVEPILNKGHKVLIHCQNGAGRSPLAVIAVLVSRGMKTSDALRLIKRKHPKTGLTDNQRYFLDNELGQFIKGN